MIKHFFLSCTLFSLAATGDAAERFLVSYELLQGGNKIESGRSIVLPKPHTWSNGLTRSYLKLSCQQKEKIYSTEDHFDGLQITHSVIGDQIKLMVVYTDVKPRFMEIRALARNECKELAPIISTITESYLLPAKDGTNGSNPFGEDMIFTTAILSVGGTR